MKYFYLLFSISILSTSGLSAKARDTYNKISPLIFQVKTSSSRDLEKNSYGTGFVVDSKGLLLTNYHVVADALWKKKELKIYVLIDKKNIEAEIINVDFVNDLALIRVPNKFNKVIRLAARLPEKGDTVFSLGLPQDLEWTVISGLYNGISKRGPIDSFYMSTPLNSGMSGGPTVNENNELVAVNVSTLRRGALISFGVPLHVVKNFLAEKPSAEKKEDKDYLSQLSQQLTNVQNSLTKEIALGLSKSKKMNAAKTPDFSKEFKCWSDSENSEKLKYTRDTETCSNESGVPLADENTEGIFKSNFTYYQNRSLNPMQWQYLKSKTFDRKHRGFIRPMKTSLISFNCKTF